MGTLFKNVQTQEPGFAGDELEQSSTTPTFKPGAVMNVMTEFGQVECKYVQNIGTTAVQQGRVMQNRELPVLVTAQSGTNYFQTTASLGAANRYVGAMAIVVQSGTAAPEAEVAIVNRHTSETTSSFYLDRGLSASLGTNDRIDLKAPGGYRVGVAAANQVIDRPGFACTTIAAGSYGWVVTAGIHPRVHIAADIINTARDALAKATTLGRVTTGTTNCIATPVQNSTCDVTVSSHWPMIVHPFYGTLA